MGTGWAARTSAVRQVLVEDPRSVVTAEQMRTMRRVSAIVGWLAVVMESYVLNLRAARVHLQGRRSVMEVFVVGRRDRATAARRLSVRMGRHVGRRLHAATRMRAVMMAIHAPATSAYRAAGVFTLVSAITEMLVTMATRARGRIGAWMERAAVVMPWCALARGSVWTPSVSRRQAHVWM